MRNTNVILYSAGAYGNFINWCCSYFSGLISNIAVPFTDVGSVHNLYPGKKSLVLPKQFEEFINSTEEPQFVQMHETSALKDSYNRCVAGNFSMVLSELLFYLDSNFSKTIYVYPTINSIDWITNNRFYKINPFKDYARLNITDDPYEYFLSNNVAPELVVQLKETGISRLKIMLDQQVSIDNIVKHGCNSIADLQLWQLRELSSEYFYNACRDQLLSLKDISELKTKFKNIHFVSLDTFRDNFVYGLLGILNHFNIKAVDENDVKKIHDQWLPKQEYINRDRQLNEITDALTNSIELDWATYNLTFFDEIVIQRKLLDRNIKIKCWNLDIFPTNTKDFLPLLERK